MDNLKVIQRVIDELKFMYEHKVPVTETDKENYITIIEALDKQIPKAVSVGEYMPECDDYNLMCPVCNAFAGLWDNEDGEEIYKYNVVFDWCPECGQRLKQPEIVEG